MGIIGLWGEAKGEKPFVNDVALRQIRGRREPENYIREVWGM